MGKQADQKKETFLGVKSSKKASESVLLSDGSSSTSPVL